VESYFYELPKTNVKGYNYQQVYKECIVENEARNALIAKTLISLWHERRFTLCLVKEVAHGEILSKLTGIPFANGADDDSRIWIKRFVDGDLKVLIATSGLMGEGVDSRPAEYLVLAGLGRAKSMFMQAVGRTVRKFLAKESGKIILFKDKSHKYLLRSFQSHVKILKEEYDSVPHRLEIE